MTNGFKGGNYFSNSIDFIMENWHKVEAGNNPDWTHLDETANNIGSPMFYWAGNYYFEDPKAAAIFRLCI